MRPSHPHGLTTSASSSSSPSSGPSSSLMLLRGKLRWLCCGCFGSGWRGLFHALCTMALVALLLSVSLLHPSASRSDEAGDVSEASDDAAASDHLHPNPHRQHHITPSTLPQTQTQQPPSRNKKSSPFRFDHTPADDTDTARLRAWFDARVHPRHEAVMIVSTNSGAVPMAANLVCSLLRAGAIETLESLVFWAVDSKAAAELMELRERWWGDSYTSSEQVSLRMSDANGTSVSGRGVPKRKHYQRGDGSFERSTPARVSKGSRYSLGKGFSVYYDRSLSATESLVTGRGSEKVYLAMMGLRLKFYMRILDTLKISFVFADADIYFFADPFADLNLPYGVPDRTEPSVPSSRAKNKKDLHDDLPDIVYSTDARRPYRYLRDPWEGNVRIPKICGGFFFVRSNERTIRLFGTVRDRKLNDQWGVDRLMNGHEFPAVLVDPLPAGLPHRKPWISYSGLSNGAITSYEAQWTMRIRILSQAAYTNALPDFASPGTRGPGWWKLVQELKDRGYGEKEVMFHPNYWREQNAFTGVLKRIVSLIWYATFSSAVWRQDVEATLAAPWVWSDNKTWVFDSLQLWKLRDGMCELK